MFKKIPTVNIWILFKSNWFSSRCSMWPLTNERGGCSAPFESKLLFSVYNESKVLLCSVGFASSLLDCVKLVARSSVDLVRDDVDWVSSFNKRRLFAMPSLTGVFCTTEHSDSVESCLTFCFNFENIIVFQQKKYFKYFFCLYFFYSIKI